MTLVVFDLETTGLDPERDEIREIGAVALDENYEVIDEFECKVRIDESKAPDWLDKTTHNREVWMKEADSPRVAALWFGHWLRKHATIEMPSKFKRGKPYRVVKLAAYNAKHDGEFIKAYFRRMGEKLPADPRVLCVMQLVMWVYKEDVSAHPEAGLRLGPVLQALDIQERSETSHMAIDDARDAARVVRRIIYD